MTTTTTPTTPTTPSPDTHFDKTMLAGLIVLFVVLLLAYVLYDRSPSDIIIGAFTTWIGGLLGILANIVTGRPVSSRATDPPAPPAAAPEATPTP